MLLAHPAIAEELLCQVVGISDGDTLTLLTQDHCQIRVRLAGIDAPESRQPYGSRARQELSQLSFRQAVRVIVEDTDRYGRTVGKVMLRSLDLNAELVRRGAAWVFPQHNRDPTLPPLQAAARQAQRGLWALPASEQVPPWEWQQNGRSACTSSPPPVSAPSRPLSPP
jgi:endonuclease YncB( thermonuclease family)